MGDKKHTVLVIDSNPTFRGYVLQAVEGHEPYVAETVKLGFEMFKQLKPNITFLDYELPDGAGFDLLVAIRKEDPTAYVVLMTTHTESEVVIKAKKLGASGYVVKPFTIQKIKQCIDRFEQLEKAKETGGASDK